MRNVDCISVMTNDEMEKIMFADKGLKSGMGGFKAFSLIVPKRKHKPNMHENPVCMILYGILP